MDISFIHSVIWRFLLETSCFNWDMLLVSDQLALVSGSTIFIMTKTFRPRHIEFWRCTMSWKNLNCASHLWSVIFWSTGSEYWIWGVSGRWLPAWGGGVLFCIIVLCGVVPHIFSWVVFPQVFIVWVNDSLFNGRLGINFVLEFSRRVEIFSGSKNMYCCLGSKCGYRILQLLVKLIPL